MNKDELNVKLYNKNINYRNKILSNDILAYKFLTYINRFLFYIKDEYEFDSILNNSIKSKITLHNDVYDLGLITTHSLSLVYDVNILNNKKHLYHSKHKVTKEIILKPYYRTEEIFKNASGHSWYNDNTISYLNEFQEFLPSSKNYKKKLLKSLYIFEQKYNDGCYIQAYKVLFKHLFNFYDIKYIVNVKNINDSTKIKKYKDVYQLTNFNKILTKLERRNKSIKDIIKLK